MVAFNASLLRAIANFNSNAASHLQIKLDLVGFRNFFLNKAMQSTDIQ